MSDDERKKPDLKLIKGGKDSGKPEAPKPPEPKPKKSPDDEFLDSLREQYPVNFAELDDPDFDEHADSNSPMIREAAAEIGIDLKDHDLKYLCATLMDAGEGGLIYTGIRETVAEGAPDLLPVVDALIKKFEGKPKQ